MNTHTQQILNDIKENCGKWIIDSRVGEYYLIGCIDLIDDICTISLNNDNNDLHFNTCIDNYTVCKNQKEAPKYDIIDIRRQLIGILKKSIDIEIDYNTKMNNILSDIELNELNQIYSSLETNPCFHLI